MGVPFIYDCYKSSDFQFIIDKLMKRLNGWKSNSLSLAGRVTLAKSALSTIPSYVMQTMKIPIGVCNKIDRICRNFIWGTNENRRKIHLVSWEHICKPKEEGGLGFQTARAMNKAYLMKLAWGLTSQPDSLWV